MTTQILSVTTEDRYRESVRTAGKILRDGGLVVFPTETVYGLAASAEHAGAVQRLRAIKQRADSGPLTVHIGQRSAADEYLLEVPGAGRRLMARGWPGPLTLVFGVSDPGATAIVHGRDPGLAERIYFGGTVGLRFPDCQAACDIIREAGCVVVASSANRKGEPPPNDAAEIAERLGDSIDAVADGGKTRYGGSSTIARVTPDMPEILRSGVIDERTVRRWASNTILIVCTGNTCRSPMAEGLLRSLLAQRAGCDPADLESRGYRVQSAGAAAADGIPAAPQAVQALAERNIDISEHRSVALSAELVHDAQVILVMTEAHLRAVLQLDPQAAEKTALLGRDQSIEDPFGGSLAVYQSCRDQIAACLETHLTETLL